SCCKVIKTMISVDVAPTLINLNWLPGLQKPSFRPKRKNLSPLTVVFSPKLLLSRLPFGLPHCGVLVKLKASARNCRLNLSVIRNCRKRPKSHCDRNGPRRVFRPRAPKRARLFGSASEPTARKASTSKYFCPAPLFPKSARLGLIWSAVWLLPGAFNVVPDEVTLKGVPLKKLRMLLACQPPTIDERTPRSLRNRWPLPNGNSMILVICRLCGRSKSLSERFR